MKDECVMCGKETIYDRRTPIHYRYCYVEGVGQLCSGCHSKYVPT